MLKTHDSPTVRPTTSSPAPIPAVVLCGPTYAGKTTIAHRVAEAAVLENLYLDSSHDDDQNHDEVRLFDLRLLDRLANRQHPAVVESDALPRLLPVDNAALVVGVVASVPVRARRLRTLFPGLDIAEAIRAVEGADVTRNARLRAAWGVDFTRPETKYWQADLVVGCPAPLICPDEVVCLDTVTDLVVAAYSIYEHLLSSTPLDDRRNAIDAFARLRRQHAGHVSRISPILMNPTSTDRGLGSAAGAWRGRLLGELEQRKGLW